MVKTEEMIDFVEKVMEMRRVQKEFFKTRNYAAMQLSKSLEKDIDDRAGKLMSQLKAMEHFLSLWWTLAAIFSLAGRLRKSSSRLRRAVERASFP